MRTISVAGVVLSLTLTANAQVLVDEFSDGTLDPGRWTGILPNANTQLYEADDVLTFVNQGTVLAKQEFGPSLTVNGRLRFTGSDQDGFVVWFRTDGVLNALSNPINAVSVGIRSSDFNHPAEVELHLRSAAIGVEWLAEATTASRIEMNEWVEFRIEDDGSTVTVYIGDLATPIVEVAVADDFGDKIVLRNRERQASDCVTQLDWIHIRGAVSVPGLGVGPARYYRTTWMPGMDYELVTRNTPLDADWHRVGHVLRGAGEEAYGFVRGAGVGWLPSHAWRISEQGDRAALAFDGVDDFLFGPHADPFNLGAGMTLEAWVKPAVGGYPGVVLAKALSSAIVSYSLELDDAGRALFRVFDAGGSAFVALSSSSPLPVETWTHLAATWNGAEAALVLNGAVDGSAAGAGAVRISALAPLNIGGILGAASYGGLVDEVRIWGSARSAAAIADTYRTGLSGAEPGLVAYWPMVEGAGQVVGDAAPGGRNLSLGESDAADPSDPGWAGESFPTESTLEMIWDFGRPWHVVHWDATEGGAYRLEQTADLAGGIWTTCIETVAQSSGPMEYYPLPPGEGPAVAALFGAYRLWGPPLPVDAGLVAHYPLDGNGEDISGNAHHGVIAGTPAEVEGVQGTALEFSGSEYIRIPDHPDLFSGNFSAVLWIKTESAGAIRGAIAKGQAFTPESFRILLLDDGDVQFSFRADGDQSGSISTPYSPYLGIWTMITVVYDSAATRMYINDQLVEEKPFTSGPLQSDRDVLIGAGAFGTNGETPEQFWQGSIDEVRIYNRALETSEVEVLYALDSP